MSPSSHPSSDPAPADPYREWDAAYVLGALDPADRRAFEEHLATCEGCRAAVAELAGMPGLLGAVAAADVEPGGAPGAPDVTEGDVVPLDGLVRAARRSRTRRRSLAAVAAVALVLGGTAAGLAWAGAFDTADGAGPVAVPSPDPGTGSPAGARTVELEPVGGTQVTATLTATPRPWGTSLAWSCRYPPPPDGTSGYGSASAEYELVLVDRDGGRSVAATWTASGTVSTGLGASSAVALADVARVEIAVAGSTDALAGAAL